MDDGEANLPAPLASASGPTKNSLVRPINPDFNLSRSFTSTSTSSSSSSSSFSSSSPPGLLRHVQAAFKRHRSLGMMQSNTIKPRRSVVPQRETSKGSASDLGPAVDLKKSQDEVFRSHDSRIGDCFSQTQNVVPVVLENQADASITPPSMSGTITNTYEDISKPFGVQRDQSRSFADNRNSVGVASALVQSRHVPLVDGQKKVQFSLGNNARSQGADNQMATGTDNILSHISSLALTEMEWDASNQPEAVTAISQDLKHQNVHNTEAEITLQSDGANSSLIAKRTMELQGQLHQLRNFLHGDSSHPVTQSSVVGSSCATTTLVNSGSAPMPNSMTYCSRHQNSQSNIAIETLGDCNVNSQSMTQGHMEQTSMKYTSKMSVDQTATEAQAPSVTVDAQIKVEECGLAKELHGSERKESDILKDRSPPIDKSNKGEVLTADVTDLQNQASLSKKPSSDVQLEPPKSEKQEKVASSKAAPRKRNYDPDLFFKVNGKLYQRLGKIGSGGSSEVHKVISSDCRIYALKKIKLKGRDYATAYGFSQEIEYLNKLKGKDNIIQLIDYEVTDKTLLQEVMNGSMSNKDGRVKDDGYIYMVLEYGEIDLAHMLSQKWKEMDGTNSTIDDNWLRFYWQVL
ncbi:putative protein kinase 1 [Actinidia rufa]|uniref:Protein kinase domain-containing protein n=1 Tax=Actinidia rufa TaxID=165716 RepID=A0A7J0DSZ3_9ERIC|nr:putative protein kinase 1 [Actinidia rufa]